MASINANLSNSTSSLTEHNHSNPSRQSNFDIRIRAERGATNSSSPNSPVADSTDRGLSDAAALGQRYGNRLRQDLLESLPPLVASQSISLRNWLRHAYNRNSSIPGRNIVSSPAAFNLSRSVSAPIDATTPPVAPEFEAANAGDVVIDFDTMGDSASRTNTRAVGQSNPNLSQSRQSVLSGTNAGGEDSANNNNNEAGATGEDATTPAEMLLQSGQIRGLEKYIPFLIILLMKLVFDHKIGLLVLLGLMITFMHANTVVKREVGRQVKRHLTSLLAIAINLLTCIFFVFYAFDDDKIYYSLAFLSPFENKPITFMRLIWVVTVADFVLKLVTVLVKVAVIALPGQVIAFQKRGKVYLFIEQTSQLYRCFVPVEPWLYYFLEAYEGLPKIFGVVLCAAYIVCKGNDIFMKCKLWKIALNKLRQNVSYGSSPTKEQLQTVGNLCPICQDDFRSATMLQCKHIFCEECVSLWFDRERTCPMCRAQIADDPSWRDGSTTYFVQLF